MVVAESVAGTAAAFFDFFFRRFFVSWVTALVLAGFRARGCGLVGSNCYGHEAGDDLLKQFSTELRSASRATDGVGRWGGDEFIVILDGSIHEAQSHVERMQKWVYGSYTLHLGAEGPKVEMTASLGLVEWQAGETLKQVLARADALMYKQKAEMHKQPDPKPSARTN